MQLHWVTAIFGGYDKARVWHFSLMWVFVLFVVPHVILVFADGWDTLRSNVRLLVPSGTKSPVSPYSPSDNRRKP